MGPLPPSIPFVGDENAGDDLCDQGAGMVQKWTDFLVEEAASLWVHEVRFSTA